MIDRKHPINESELSCRNYLEGRHPRKFTFINTDVTMIDTKHPNKESELSCRNYLEDRHLFSQPQMNKRTWLRSHLPITNHLIFTMFLGVPFGKIGFVN